MFKLNQNKFIIYLIFGCSLICLSCKGDSVNSSPTNVNSDNGLEKTNDSKSIPLDDVSAAKDISIGSNPQNNSSDDNITSNGLGQDNNSDAGLKETAKNIVDDVTSKADNEVTDKLGVERNTSDKILTEIKTSSSGIKAEVEQVVKERKDKVIKPKESVKQNDEKQLDSAIKTDANKSKSNDNGTSLQNDKDAPSNSSSEDKKEATLDMHKELDKLLQAHVSSAGKVNYKGIKGDKDRLENYLALVSNNKPKASASRDEKLVYWINIYNAYTIKMVVDNYPLNSIKDLEGGKPWDKKWINIKGTTYSLNQIENEIIRPTFNEPRIHFAVNCAAKSCPPLMNKAWNASSLEADLEKATKVFINNTTYNTIDNGKAQVSKIFDWYKEDFADIKKYISKYSGKEVKEISFKEYDWSLNN